MAQKPTGDVSSDRDDRIRDFFARHGGAGAAPAQGSTVDLDESGWSEVYAADGHRLRCDWSRIGGRAEMKFTELPP